MPITHITFLEQADQSNKLCYLWIIQSDNSILPNAMMIALSYEHRTIMSNGHSSYRVSKILQIIELNNFIVKYYDCMFKGIQRFRYKIKDVIT